MNKVQKDLFVNLTEFLGEVLGGSYEVVTHAIENGKASIIAIANNHISGRTLDSPLTTFATKLIQEKVYLKENFVCDYKASVGKSKLIQGSTFFIKNEDELLGILCINRDTTELNQAISKIIELEKLEDFSNMLASTMSVKENSKITDIEELSHSIEDILAENIDLQYLNSGFMLTKDQKEDVISKLYNKGIFNIKGVIPTVAKYLNISEPSVYRYLQKLKR